MHRFWILRPLRSKFETKENLFRVLETLAVSNTYTPLNVVIPFWNPHNIPLQDNSLNN